MEIDLKRILAWIKSAPLAIRVIAIVAAVDLAIILIALAALEDDVDARAQHAGELDNQLKDLEKKIQSTRAQINRLPDLQKEYDKAVKGDVLAEQDRVKFIDLAKNMVDQHKLFDFHFKLAPEKVDPLPGSNLQLVSTDVELSDSGLRDGDVFAFWDQFLVESQAHYQITKATLDLGTMSAAAAAPQIRNGQLPVLVKADISFRWQSMHKAPEAAKTADSNAPAKPAGQTP